MFLSERISAVFQTAPNVHHCSKGLVKIFALGMVALSSQFAQAATFNVSNEAELRSALLAAESNNENDTIDLGGNLITLTQDPVSGEGGQLIVGPDATSNGVNALTIQNGTIERAANSPSFRLLSIVRGPTADTASSTVFLENLALRNGEADLNDTATVNVEPSVSIAAIGGGAVYSSRTLLIRNVTFENNTVLGNGRGGAVYSLIQADVSGSIFRNNQVLPLPNGQGNGGALYVANDSVVNDSGFYENGATNGGAIYAALGSTQAIYRTTFEGNTATAIGGAVWSRTRPEDNSFASAEIETSTFVNNSAGTGGGAIYFQTPSAVSILSSTISNNTAGGVNGGGLRYFPTQDGSAVSIVNTILSENGGGNCSNSSGVGFSGVASGNITTDGTCGTDGFTLVTDASSIFSDGLSNNGSDDLLDISVLTLPIGEFSPARDAADQSACLFSDQRRFSSRTDDGACDIGAFELYPRDLDTDQDGVNNELDNCPMDPNPNQEDMDGDEIGDACDSVDNSDDDGDGVQNFEDNCPFVANPGQSDVDGNNIGDACDDADDDGVLQLDDNCPIDFNPGQVDFNLDGLGDVCSDVDGDERNDSLDNCPVDPNPNQENNDGDLLGDVCDPNDDNDTVDDILDNCPLIPNDNQADVDGDGAGDVCDDVDNRVDLDNDGIPDAIDPDDDGDGVDDTFDNCPIDVNSNQSDVDGDGAGDVCDPIDNRPDLDNDGIPDAIDPDDDGDGVDDVMDNCPINANGDQSDLDGDGAGDACDATDDRADGDGDGVVDVEDNCPLISNPLQQDSDQDGIGDACEEPTGGDGIRSEIASAANDLRAVVQSTSGFKKQVLREALRDLNSALNDRNWSSENTLTRRGSYRVFNKASDALYNIERIADSYYTSAQLRAELDLISMQVLDSLRLLATNEIALAELTNSESENIPLAQHNLARGDRQRNNDWLYGAARSYGLAWRFANRAN